MERSEINELLDKAPTDIHYVLAKSWVDADEYRSVKQNAGQRKSLIESAITQLDELIKKANIYNSTK